MRKATKLQYPVAQDRKTTKVVKRMNTAWDAAQYNRFKTERAQPFFDLMELLDIVDKPRICDLGCGTGELTRELHKAMLARETLGIDNSEAMLAQSGEFSGDGLRFELLDVQRLSGRGPFDVIFSNACLHWIDDHVGLFERLTKELSAQGQLAVQMPANHDHLSHEVAHEVAREEPFAAALDGYVRSVPVLPPEDYAWLLHKLGFKEQLVKLHVYGHVLGSTEDVVEWVKGTLLTDYKKRLEAPLYDKFLARYRERLIERLGFQRPYFYAFKRILLWARR